MKLSRISCAALLWAACWASSSVACCGTTEPFNKAAQAFYQYEHWDQDVARFLNHYNDKLSPRQKEIGAWIGFGIKCLLDGKVEFTYHFP